MSTGNEHRATDDSLDEHQISALVAARGNGGRHHSVIGLTAADGGGLNYEETVVYENRAAIPSYLIVYRF